MPYPLYTALPPKLEIFKMDQDARLGNLKYEARLNCWLQDTLDHKTAYFPSLRSVILRESFLVTEYADDFPGTIEVLERMYVFPLSVNFPRPWCRASWTCIHSLPMFVYKTYSSFQFFGFTLNYAQVQLNLTVDLQANIPGCMDE